MKWQDSWYANNIYAADDNSAKPKKYVLVEFPFPSGVSLYMGHIYRYTVPDIYNRCQHLTSWWMRLEKGGIDL